MASPGSLPPSEVDQEAVSCIKTLQRLLLNGHNVGSLVIELAGTRNSYFSLDAIARNENLPATTLARRILLKASTVLRDAFNANIMDEKTEGILDDWGFTLETVDRYADRVSLSVEETQMKIELWQACRAHFDTKGTWASLERNIHTGLRVLEAGPETSRSYMECALDVGHKQAVAYSFRPGLPLLQAAISRLSGILNGLSPSQAEREKYQPVLDSLFLSLINESATYQTHFWETEDFSHLEKAVALAKEAWTGLATSSWQQARYRAHYELGLVQQYRYLHLGHFSDLQRASENALSALTNWDPEFTLPKSDVARAMRFAWCLKYYDNVGIDQLEDSVSVMTDLDKGFKDGESEPGLTANVGSTHAFYLNCLSEVYRIIHHRRCHLDPSTRWLDLAVEFSGRSCGHVGPKDPGRYEAIVEHTTALMTRFISGGARPGDLDRAIEAATTATGLAYHPIYTNRHNTPRRCQRYVCKTLDIATDVLTARYLRDGDRRDLDEADHAAHCVSISTHSLHPLRPYQVFSKLERCRLRLLSEDQKTSTYSRLCNLLTRRSHQDRNSIAVSDSLPSTSAVFSVSTNMKSSTGETALYRRRGLAIVLGNETVYFDNSLRVAERGSYPLDLRFTYDTPQYLLESRPCSRTSFQEHDVQRLSDVSKLSASEGVMLTKKSISDAEDLFEYLRMLEKGIKASLARKEASKTLELGEVAIRLTSNIDQIILEGGLTTGQTRLIRRLSLLVARELLTQNKNAWEGVRALEAGQEAGARFEPKMLSSYCYKTTHLIREADEINARLRGTTTERQDRMKKEAATPDKFQQSSEALFGVVKDFAEIKELIPNHVSFEEECIKQAEGGFIVFLVPAKSTRFAILISAAGADALQLPAASARELGARLSDTFAALRECEESGIKGKVNPKLRKLLEWLWRAIVRPVVVRLNLKPDCSPDASLKLPLIRWITLGLFAQAPLHAAGRHKGQKSNLLSHYAISSYLPSIRYASFTRGRYSSDSSISPNNLLMIGGAKTNTTSQGERLADLDFDRERDRIKTALGGHFIINCLINPEMGTLESLLTHVRLVHFTCHGLPHATDPQLSRLVICKDGSRPLTVASIREMAVPGAKMAFVSACHSAIYRESEGKVRQEKEVEINHDEPGDDNGDEEPALHLARALQLAGFPTVVGTLWQAYQDSAIEISSHFYQFVADRWNSAGESARKGKILNSDLFARALHYALRRYQGGGEEEGANMWETVDWAGWMCFGD